MDSLSLQGQLGESQDVDLKDKHGQPLVSVLQ